MQTTLWRAQIRDKTRCAGDMRSSSQMCIRLPNMRVTSSFFPLAPLLATTTTTAAAAAVLPWKALRRLNGRECSWSLAVEKAQHVSLLHHWQLTGRASQQLRSMVSDGCVGVATGNGAESVQMGKCPPGPAEKSQQWAWQADGGRLVWQGDGAARCLLPDWSRPIAGDGKGFPLMLGDCAGAAQAWRHQFYADRVRE